jgi:hypothetical protein
LGRSDVPSYRAGPVGSRAMNIWDSFKGRLRTWDVPPSTGGPQPIWNHYRCQACGCVTITKHREPGVTPFMLKCYVTPGCEGVAYSGFYRGSQDPRQRAHVTWIRMATPEALEAWLAKIPEADREWYRDHHDKGGCLLVEGEF